MSKPMPKAEAAATPAPPAEPRKAVTAAEMGARQRNFRIGILHQESPPVGFRQPAQVAAHLLSKKRSTTRWMPAKRRAFCPKSSSNSKSRPTMASRRRRARRPLPRHRHRLWPGHRAPADPADLRQAALRLEVSSPAHEPRPARHRHLGRRHVRPAHHRQAGADHFPHRRQDAGALFRSHRSIPRKTNRGFFENKQIDWENHRGTQVSLEIEGRYQKGRASVDEYLEQTAIANPAR